MKHAYTDLAARCRVRAEDIRAAEVTSADVPGILDLAADIIDRHGQLLTRLKSAIGPALVRAAEIEATG